MSSKQIIKTPNAPNPVGPYNQAIKVGNFIYCSGQIAINPVSNEIPCLGDIKKETFQVLKNLSAVLNAGGSKLEDVVKTTIYLTDLNNFQIVNEIYSDFYRSPSCKGLCRSLCITKRSFNRNRLYCFLWLISNYLEI